MYNGLDPSLLIADDPVVVIPIDRLVVVDSPRLLGVDVAHVRALAEVGSSLPPIMVNRTTMRVVDGVHRVKAALLRGETTIEARFFSGSDNEAFVVSVRENTAHGLPLSLTDRKAAAARILVHYSHWSDRAIAAVAGLSASSVGAIRRRSGGGSERQGGRIGRDGRVRPVDTVERRRRAGELIAAEPKAPLRQIAKEAHVSLGTAHAVRKLVLEGGPNALAPAAPAPGKGTLKPMSIRRPRTPTDSGGAVDWVGLRQQLRMDPALRYTESGRRVLRWLDACAISFDELRDVAESIPPHWSRAVSHVAYRFAQEWLEFAELLDRNEDVAGNGEVTA